MAKNATGLYLVFFSSEYGVNCTICYKFMLFYDKSHCQAGLAVAATNMPLVGSHQLEHNTTFS